ncbi:MAG: insulinase family protein [Puniceicoccales bacterium]|jgi:zinc protease|nr:insulinase family protein [Puniceicoccales bacterium]
MKNRKGGSSGTWGYVFYGLSLGLCSALLAGNDVTGHEASSSKILSRELSSSQPEGAALPLSDETDKPEAIWQAESAYSAAEAAEALEEPLPGGVASLPPLESYLHDDSKILAGTLANGFRYVLYPHPKERIYAILCVQAGSLMERPVAGGVAHFLEHMAFCGSRHFPKRELVHYLEKLGMAFGPDLNAFTALEYTCYLLDLPRGDEGLFGTALDVFHDYACGLEISSEEVEREKGVILAEVRDRDGPALRVFRRLVQHMFAETLFADAISVGEPEIIRKIGAPQLREFYQRWYTPDRMILVIVGDFVPEKWRPLVESKMSSIPVKAKLANPYEGEFPSLKRRVFRYLRDEQLDKVAISVAALSPALPKGDSVERQRKEVSRLMAQEILRERLLDRNRERNNLFLSPIVEQCELFPGCHYSNVFLGGLNDWRSALVVLEQELRRIQLFGFQAEEIDRIRRKLLSGLEHTYRRFESLRSSDLALSLMNSRHRDLYWPSPQDSCELSRRLLKDLGPSEVTEAWNELWAYPNRFVFMSGPEVLPETIHGEIQKIFEDSSQAPLEPMPTRRPEDFGYEIPSSKEAIPSLVEAHHYVEDLDFHQVVFKNRVRLNVKTTGFKKDYVKVAMHFGQGLLGQEKGQEGLMEMLGSLFKEGGLGKHSLEELRKIWADRVLSFQFDVEGDAFVMYANSSSRDFRFLCELARAYFEDPAYRGEARQDALKYFRQREEAESKSPGAVYAQRVPYRLSGEHFAFRRARWAEIERWSAEDVAQYFENILKRAYLEISVVGDISSEEAICSVGETLGRLPAREDFPESLERNRILKIPSAERVELSYCAAGSEHPTAELHLFWPGLLEENTELYRRQCLLAKLLSGRLFERIRHDLGEAYSPYARYLESEVFPAYRWIHADISVDPKKIRALESTILAEVEHLRKEGISEDEFQRILEPERQAIRDRRKRNGYWLYVLSRSQADGRSLSYARTLENFYQQVRREDLEEVARRVLRREALHCYHIRPDDLRKERKRALFRHRGHR